MAKRNYVLNPNHPEFRRIELADPVRGEFGNHTTIQAPKIVNEETLTLPIVRFNVPKNGCRITISQLPEYRQEFEESKFVADQIRFQKRQETKLREKPSPWVYELIPIAPAT